MIPRFSLHHGDCTAILATLPSGSVDLVVTDPPYVENFRDRQGRRIRTVGGMDWIEPAYAELFRVLKPDSFCLSFYGWPFIDRFMAAWKAAGFRPVGHLFWEKPYTSSVGYVSARHEEAFLLAKGDPARPAKPLPDVLPWEYSGNPLHPTQKAVSVIQPLVETFSQRGDLVLDPFMGSGTTGLACARLDRRFVGIELDETYHRAAERRIEDAYRRADLIHLRVAVAS